MLGGGTIGGGAAGAVEGAAWGAAGGAAIGSAVQDIANAIDWSDLLPNRPPWGPFPDPGNGELDEIAQGDPNGSGDSDRARECREECSSRLPGEAAYRNCLRDCMRNPNDYGCN